MHRPASTVASNLLLRCPVPFGFECFPGELYLAFSSDTATQGYGFLANFGSFSTPAAPDNTSCLSQSIVIGYGAVVFAPYGANVNCTVLVVPTTVDASTRLRLDFTAFDVAWFKVAMVIAALPRFGSTTPASRSS